MNLNSVLSQLITKDISFPALKLAWESQVQLPDVGILPKISPSHYMQENLLTTDQRRALICKQQRKVPCRKADVDLFVEPAVIVFQNYKFGDTLSFPISIRNISKTYQKVTILMDENNVFRFDENSARVAKFPSGMSIIVTIKFQPEDDGDYYHKLVVKTPKARFAIPIIGIGGRGLLNVADSIIFEKVPVKYYKTSVIPVYNLGTKPARFTLSTTGQFCVKPEKGIVSPRETFNLEVSHYSASTGIRDGHLLIKYDNGEEVYVYLKAETISEDVSLTPQVVQCEDTYLGMKTKVLCSIQNNSEVILDFKWSNNFMPQIHKGDGEWMKNEENDSLGVMDVYEEDDEHNLSKAIDLLEKCTGRKSEDCAGFVLEDFEEQITTWESRIQETFSNENFIIQPLVGKVQPRSSIDVYVIFGPTDSTVINTTAYLDITGREERIPLYISGKGLGPKFKLAFDVLDVGDVFLGGTHCYEIPVLNTGDISGSIDALGVITKSSAMTMIVEPKRIELTPNEHGAFYLSFSCTGKPVAFSEELVFAISNSDEMLYLTIKGSIAFPKVHFLSKEANFGLVSYGFEKSIQLSLLNDSLNYVEVSLKMESNGVDPPVDFNKILESFKTENFKFDEDPAEFIFEPARFSLRPKGMQNITLTLCANQVRDITNTVVCYLVDTDGTLVQDVAWVPVTACCAVPDLTTEILDFYLPGCYTYFPYTVELEIQNSTELSTCYCIVPQKSGKMKLTSETFVGVAPARELTTIPVTVICTAPGKGITAQLDFYTVAIEEKVFTFTVKADVILSRLEAFPTEIDFGDVDVMSPVPTSVDIMNKSPLTVHYVAIIRDGGKNGDVWDVDQEVGIIEPNATITLVITATLTESGLHETVLRVEMQEALTFVDVKMMIRGTGASLQFEPVLYDEIEFGTIFTKSEKSFQYEVKNVGHLPKVLEWRHIKDPPPEYPPPPAKKEIKASRRPSQEDRQGTGTIKKVPPLPGDFYAKRTLFKISPLKKLLEPDSSMTLTFTASSTSSKSAEENFVLWTYTPKPPEDAKKVVSTRAAKNKKPDPNEQMYQPIISRNLKLKASVESVSLLFSAKEMLFRIDSSPVQESFEQKDTLKIENTGQLPVTVKFKTSFPFSLIVHQDQEPVEELTHTFNAEETFWLTINFDGRHLRKDRGSVYFDSMLSCSNIGLPGQESIKLRGEVHFPTLNFTTNEIDFGSIPNGTEAVEEFEVTNPGVYCLAYKWYIKPGSTIIEFEDDEEEEGDDEFEDGFNEDVEVYPDYSLGEEEEEEEDEDEEEDGEVEYDEEEDDEEEDGEQNEEGEVKGDKQVKQKNKKKKKETPKPSNSKEKLDKDKEIKEDKGKGSEEEAEVEEAEPKIINEDIPDDTKDKKSLEPDNPTALDDKPVDEDETEDREGRKDEREETAKPDELKNKEAPRRKSLKQDKPLPPPVVPEMEDKKEPKKKSLTREEVEEPLKKQEDEVQDKKRESRKSNKPPAKEEEAEEEEEAKDEGKRRSEDKPLEEEEEEIVKNEDEAEENDENNEEGERPSISSVKSNKNKQNQKKNKKDKKKGKKSSKEDKMEEEEDEDEGMIEEEMPNEEEEDEEEEEEEINEAEETIATDEPDLSQVRGPRSHCLSDSSDSDHSLLLGVAEKVVDNKEPTEKDIFLDTEMEGEDAEEDADEEEGEEETFPHPFGDLNDLDQLAQQQEQAYRSKMLEMLGLADPQEEVEDEVNYLSHNRNEVKHTGPININEVIDIIPLSGIISAGNSLNFTAVFYGHTNIRFQTTAICYVEGGTSKTVTIKGSCQRNKLIIPKPMCGPLPAIMKDRADGEEVIVPQEVEVVPQDDEDEEEEEYENEII